MTDFEHLTAPCGIDCFNCILYKENITDETQQRLALQFNRDKDSFICKGCRDQKGCAIHPGLCATLECVTEKGYTFCFECDEFPCTKLQPMAEGADRFPHNTKLFNLCRIQKVGIQKWAEEEAALVSKRYFKGKFVIGAGPTLPEE